MIFRNEIGDRYFLIYTSCQLWRRMQTGFTQQVLLKFHKDLHTVIVVPAASATDEGEKPHTPGKSSATT